MCSINIRVSKKEHLVMPEYAHGAMNFQANDRVYNLLCGSKIPFRYVEK